MLASGWYISICVCVLWYEPILKLFFKARKNVWTCDLNGAAMKFVQQRAVCCLITIKWSVSCSVLCLEYSLIKSNYPASITYLCHMDLKTTFRQYYWNISLANIFNIRNFLLPNTSIGPKNPHTVEIKFNFNTAEPFKWLWICSPLTILLKNLKTQTGFLYFTINTLRRPLCFLHYAVQFITAHSCHTHSCQLNYVIRGRQWACFY